MSLKDNDNVLTLPLWQKGVNRMRALLYRSPLYLLTLRKKAHLDIRALPDNLKSGNPDQIPALKKQSFSFAGRSYQSGDHPWSTAQDDPAWQSWVHGFHWLNDLADSKDPEAIALARQYIQSWLDLHGIWSPLAWRADVMGDRLVHWMAHAETLCASASEEFSRAFYTSLSIQASHLTRARFRDLTGYALLRALRGQLYVSLLISEFNKKTSRILARFEQVLDTQILADGGHISRCPTTLFQILRMLLEMMEVFNTLQVECPTYIRLNIDRIAPMVRTLRHSDGGFALFHGAQEGDPGEIEQVLDQTGNLGAPLSDARHTGFERIEAGRSVLLMDVAAPPDIHAHPFGHAAPLSLELSNANERILVNCGAVIGGDPGWQDALSATAAHNCLRVDDKNCFTVLHGGGIKPSDCDISYQRHEENGQVLIEAQHDAYKESFGLLHKRSVYLNKTGDDLRVEDHLIGMGGSTYAIALHLHPDVHASLVQDGQAALLKTQKGAGWHLRVQGGKLDIRESIYIARPGQMRHTDQIVIQGPLRGEGVCVKWRLGRLGG